MLVEKMKLKKLLIILILLPAIANAERLNNAILYGNLLTEAVQQKNKIKLKKLAEYKDIKKYLSANKCPKLKYKAYTIGAKDRQYLYLLASKGDNVIIGRHFKAPIQDGTVLTSAFQSSTKSCLDLGNPKTNNAVAMFATHLQPFPNEFHVLQSNLSNITLYIRTSNGLYVIDNGSIELSPPLNKP